MTASGCPTANLAELNPLRYRGYYYDTETGWYYLQSRYYDPIIKRFLNADTYASTGQGFLGYNMFAYCGNNPVNAYDPSGCRCILEDDRKDFGNGCVGYTDTGTGSSYTYICDQDDPSVSNKPFGASTVSHSGCAAVAVYNALIMLGDYVPFDDVLKYFNQDVINKTFLFGVAGTLPSTVCNYFSERGYRVFCCNTLEDADCMDMVSTVADACILWYVYKTDSFLCGGHYIAYNRIGDKGSLSFVGYNTSENNGIFSFYYPSRYGTSNNRVVAVCIAIYKEGD